MDQLIVLLAFILMIAGFLVWFGIIMLDAPNTVIGGIVFICIGIALVILFFSIIVYNVRQHRKSELTRKYANWAKDHLSFERGKLYLHNRSTFLDSVLTYEPIRNYHIDYKPAELVYTSATSGGVTTGGFHVNKEEYSLGGGEKTGRYEFYYCSDGTLDSKEHFTEIILDNDLIESAKNNSIVRRFLNGNTLFLKHNMDAFTEKSLNYGLSNARKANDGIAAQAALKQMQISEGLTKDECDAIYKWLTGND